MAAKLEGGVCERFHAGSQGYLGLSFQQGVWMGSVFHRRVWEHSYKMKYVVIIIGTPCY